ncbi:MAG: hypothetical protein Q7J08_00415 [Methanocorpusculum sp.]|uniref:hypothetical protein n=1 Tax=Methanocorpusculum sp. TaxID=2058474 RepID=UPI0027293915|nr:hypothetical protein [Methanocorpusculum sp.]MDO9522165.1 hypothetical protein [Methanocorpusculum sp.]
MASIQLSKKTFRNLIIGMGIVIVITVAAIIFFGNGGFSLFTPEQIVENPEDIVEETGPWGAKTFEWEYNGDENSVTVLVTKDAYKMYNTDFGGTDIPQDLYNYIILSGDDGCIADTAWQLSNIADANTYNSEETINLVCSFVKSLSYQTDSETGRSSEYPRAPVVTLADETGDSEDLTILASALLEEMGYGSALLYYPLKYDRLTIIPEATALGLVGTDPANGMVYRVNTTYPLTTISISAEKTTVYPLYGVTTAANPSGCDTAEGWYAGTGTWNIGSLSGSLGYALYVPSSNSFSAELTPDFPKNTSSNTKVTYTIENASWTVPVKIVWLADTASKGTPVSAYNSQAPVVIQTDILWSGTSGESVQKESLDLGLLLDLDHSPEFPTIDSMLTGGKFWIAGHPIYSPLYLSEMDSDYYLTLEQQKNAQEYLESTWYPSGVSWDVEYDKWKLYEHFLTIKGTPGTLYTPVGTAEQVIETPWRITYTIDGVYDQSNLDSDMDGMTPYADLNIAVYKIGDDGSITLVEITGWQDHANADTYDTSRFYSPGHYAIGIFSRNVLASVVIEYWGKNETTIYAGGI